MLSIDHFNLKWVAFSKNTQSKDVQLDLGLVFKRFLIKIVSCCPCLMAISRWLPFLPCLALLRFGKLNEWLGGSAVELPVTADAQLSVVNVFSPKQYAPIPSQVGVFLCLSVFVLFVTPGVTQSRFFWT